VQDPNVVACGRVVVVMMMILMMVVVADADSMCLFRPQ
jgi:hypothetical protein